MLIQLNVQNFALIEKISIDFESLLNVLTGETGAGKSIIIDAVSLLLGNRGSSEYIRDGAEKALVEGVFQIDNISGLEQYIDDFDTVDNILILKREISRQGKNICKINEKVLPLSIFRNIGKSLINIYGQHDYQSLLEKDNHLNLLDSFQHGDTGKIIFEVREAFTKWKECNQRMVSLMSEKNERELLLKQTAADLREIKELDLRENEEEEIDKELMLLNNIEEILHESSLSFEILYSQDSIYDKLNIVIQSLSKLENYDAFFKETFESLREMTFQIEEISRKLNGFTDNLSFDPNRKDYLMEKKYSIDSLKRKHKKNTVSELLEKADSLKNIIDELEDVDYILEKVVAEEKKLLLEYDEKASELTLLRQTKAYILSERLQEELAYLSMPEAKIKIWVKETTRSNLGKDEIEFYISPNIGEEFKPMAKIASGGEMSRIMLAMKVVLHQEDENITLIFDEIDSGIGGNVVTMVAEKLQQVSLRQQIICVTHSPQIASRANYHLKIEKRVKEGRTITEIHQLEREGRLNELARMLGNEQKSFEYAESLLNPKLEEEEND